MLATLRNKLKSLLTGGWERFLVIEESEGDFEFTKAKVNNKTKKIYISDSHKIASLEDLKKPLFSFDKIVLALSAKRALTIESVVRLKRSEPEELISEGELDTLLFRGLWEFLNHYRRWVVKKLKITDSDLVLASAEIREVLLGSYRVFNPLGFKGANLILRYRGTFISREVKGVIGKLEHWSRDFILVEGGQVLATSIPREVDYLVNVGSKITNVFLVSKEESLHIKDLPWGSVHLVKRIAEKFGVESEVAVGILLRKLKGEVSKKIFRLIVNEVKDEVAVLLRLLKSLFKTAPRPRPIFYFNFPLPQGLFQPLFKNRYSQLINFKTWLEEQDYGVVISEKQKRLMKNYESILALITHIYFPPQYQFLNQLLARRARWLIA